MSKTAQQVSEAKYLADNVILPLVGYRITGAAVDQDDEFAGVILEKKGEAKQIAWVQCDPEGNGLGFLAVEPF